MFTRFWIGYTIIGLAVAVLVFRWAVHAHQFEDSRRAALLPFDDIEPDAGGRKPEKPTPSSRTGLVVLLALAAFGLIVSLTIVILALALA